MRFSFAERNRVFQKNCVKICVREAVEDGIGPCESVERIGRWAFRQQKRSKSVSLSLFMELKIWIFEEALSTMATLCWGGRCVVGKMEQQKARRKQISERTDMETGERTCRSRHA